MKDVTVILCMDGQVMDVVDNNGDTVPYSIKSYDPYHIDCHGVEGTDEYGDEYSLIGG